MIIRYDQRLCSHQAPIIALHSLHSSDETRLLSLDSANELRIWQIGTEHITKLTLSIKSPVSSSLVHNSLLFTGHEDGSIQIWPLDSENPKVTVQAHQDEVSALMIHSGQLLSGSVDGTLSVWRLPDLSLIKILALKVEIKHIFEHVKQGLIVVSNLQVLLIENLAEAKLVHSFDEPITCAHYTHPRLYYGDLRCKLNYITLFQKEAKTEQTLISHSSWINNIFDRDGFVFTLSDEGAIFAWKDDTFELIAKLDGHKNGVNFHIKIDEVLFTSSFDTRILSWDLKKLKTELHQEVERLKQEKIKKAEALAALSKQKKGKKKKTT